MTEQYVNIKLITGEELIGEVTTQNDYSITIMNPLLVSTKLVVADDGRVYEKQTAAPYCSYSDDSIFTFDLKHVVFSKPLKPRFIPTYLDMIQRINMREMVHDEVHQYLDALESIMGGKEEQTTEDEQITYHSEAEEQAAEEIEEFFNQIQGNRTLH